MKIANLFLLAGFAGLTACGGAEPAADADATADAPAADAPAADAPAADPHAGHATGAVTCDAFADHMLATLRAQAEAEGDNEFMTVAQQMEFVTAMVDGLRTGCKSNDRLGEFPELTACFMAATTKEAWEACQAVEGHAAFDEYMKGLLASAIQIDAGAAGTADGAGAH